jgi:uncharacterized protein YbjT (DUF2867 family)
MKVLVTGATGMVGSEVIRQAVLDDRITSVVSVVRRGVASEHPKVKHVVLADFTDYAPISRELEGVSACLFCLGIAQSDAKNAADYERITVDFAVAAARALQAASPEARFCFLSAQGADSSEKSSLLYRRVKGKAENTLAPLLGEQLYTFRPAFIHPMTPRERPRIAERVLRPFYPILYRLFPNGFTNSVELSRAMLDVGVRGHAKHMLKNVDIRGLVATIAAREADAREGPSSNASAIDEVDLSEPHVRRS